MYAFLILGSFIVFIFSEKTFLHFSRTARRTFWYAISCAFGVSLVRWLQTVEGLGMVWVFLSAVLAASVVEDEVLKKTGLTPMNIEATQRVRSACRTPEAQGMAERIMDIVSAITRGKGYTAGTKQLVSRVSGATQRLQRGLHRVLATASVSELNYILCAINVAALVEVADRSTVQLLVSTRLPELNTVSRAALADGLQKLGLRYRPRRQMWVRDVILGTKGIELTHFKAYIDDGGDYHSMYKLVYNDLQGEVQAEVLEHLQREGTALLEEVRQRGEQMGLADAIPPGAVLKVLSDIDDTVFASGGSFPAGVDTRYPRKCYYPGALALYAALDRCFAQRFSSILSSLSAGPLEGLPKPLDTSQRRPSDSWQSFDDQQVESQRQQPQQQRGRSPSPGLPRIPTAPTTMANINTQPVECPYPNLGLHHLHAAPSSSSIQIGSGRGSPSDFSGPASTMFGSSPQATMTSRFLLGDLATPRDSGAFIDDCCSPRAEAMLEARAAAPAFTHQEGSNLVFLSARPESYKGLTESESYRKYFQPLVLRGDLDTSPTMLLGSLDSGPRALYKLLAGRLLLADDRNPKTAASALYQTLAAKKLSRFREYAAIYPEAAFVFVGDNGQGDVLCAEILYTSARDAAAPGPSQLLSCFIHRVVPPTATMTMLRSTPKDSDVDLEAAWKQRDIFLHRSHVGMAAQAFDLGLLDAESLYRVAAAAHQDFRRIIGRYGGRHAGRRLDKAARHLNQDLVAVNTRLPGHLPKLELLDMLQPIKEVPEDVAMREPSATLSEVTELLKPLP